MFITESVLEKIFDVGLERGADFVEVFCEKTYSHLLNLESQKISEAMTGQLYGAGIRLLYGTEEVYTYTNDLSEKNLIEITRKATMARDPRESHHIQRQPLSLYVYDNIHSYKSAAWDFPKSRKIQHLEFLDKESRQFHSEVTQVLAGMKETHQHVQVANSLGLHSQEIRQYANAFVRCVAEADGKSEVGSMRQGALASPEIYESFPWKELAHHAARLAHQNLHAGFAPAGKMPVVIDNGFGGVIFHEACGHGLETTSVAKNASVFCNKLNERLADPCVTAIDDGTLSNEYGSLSIDDEGHPTQKTVLIENGILKSYIVDYVGHLKTGYPMTGSGRRQNYRFSPASRMRNTFIAAGETPLEDMIRDVDYGLYAKKMGGGSVNPGTGEYNFAAQEAYIIRKGQICEPVKGASLIGTGIDTLGKIKKVGTELEYAAGTCGSISGQIPTTVGQPAILVSELTVGGRTQ